MNLVEQYIKGMLVGQKEKEKKDNEGPLRYRGGNCGILLNGIPVGPSNSCPRAVIARAEGRFTETSWQTQLMFDLGEINEVRWDNKLRAAGLTVISGKDLEGRIQSSCEGGTPITGSMDSMIVEHEDGDFFIEHKSLSSFWTFRDVVIENKPKLENIAQAAFYSMHLDDMPFYLLYTSSVRFSGPPFLTKLVPHPQKPNSEHFEYTYYKYNHDKLYKGKPTKKKLEVPGHMLGMYPKDLYDYLGAEFAEFKDTNPTAIQYDLQFTKDGVVQYRQHGREKWFDSPVTKQNIMDFYNYVEKNHKAKTMPKRPIVMKVDGEVKGYSPCTYCSLSEVCDKYELNFDTWLKHAKGVRW